MKNGQVRAEKGSEIFFGSNPKSKFSGGLKGPLLTNSGAPNGPKGDDLVVLRVPKRFKNCRKKHIFRSLLTIEERLNNNDIFYGLVCVFKTFSFHCFFLF